jgi:hypothetical protein
MTSTPPSNRKSLAGQVLAELLALASAQGELKAELRVRHHWQTARITQLERRMDGMAPTPPTAPSSATPPSRHTETARLIRTAWEYSKHLPWGVIGGALSLAGGLLWQWLLPLLRHLLPWVF